MPHTDTIPVSASIASTSKTSLRYIGDWCYAYSPEVGQLNSSQNLFTWRTGSGLIVGRLRITGPVDYTGPSNGRSANTRVKFNDEVIANLHNDTQNASAKLNDPSLKLLIPPFTLVVVDFHGINTAGDFKTTAVFTGRVYGAT